MGKIEPDYQRLSDFFDRMSALFETIEPHTLNRNAGLENGYALLLSKKGFGEVTLHLTETFNPENGAIVDEYLYIQPGKEETTLRAALSRAIGDKIHPLLLEQADDCEEFLGIIGELATSLEMK